MQDIFQKAMTAFVQGKIKEANKICKGIIKQQPAAHPAIHLLALTEKRKGKYHQAIKTINKALKLAPTTATYWNNLGEIYREMGNNPKAIESYKKAIKYKPDYAEAYTNWGAILVNQEFFTEAEKHLLTAIGINSQLANAHYNLGVLYTEAGSQEQARNSFNKAVDIEPANVEALANLADLDQSENKFNDAKAKYLRAISIDPTNLKSHIGFGNLCNNRGFYNEAIKYYSIATKINPKSLEAWIGLGKSYRNNAFLDAYHAFNTALSINGRSKEAMLGLASCILFNSENTKAIQILNRYKNTFGTDANFNLLMANFYLHNRSCDKAHEAARSCLATESGNVYAYQIIARTSKTSNIDHDLKEMLRLFDKSVNSKDQQSNLAFSISKIMDRKGDYDSAFKYLEKANLLKIETLACKSDYLHDIENNHSQLKAVFTHDFIQKNKKYGFNSANPIFIVGLPRSGKTVTESVLCNNTHATPGGESRQFTNIFQTVLKNEQLTTEPESILKLNKHLLSAIGEKYVDSLNKRFETSCHVTNTLPGNASNLGAISICLPKAKIIWVYRTQLDTCFDMYSKNFARGHEYTYDQESLARYTKLFNELMEYWTQVIPENIFKLQFEDFISEPEKWLRKIAEFCQLDLGVSMKNGTENTDQTLLGYELIPDREDICDIWKPYEKHLQPLLKTIEHEGIKPYN